MRALRRTRRRSARRSGASRGAAGHDAATALRALPKAACDDRTAAGVLQTCCGGEPTYNPFYAAVAKLRGGRRTSPSASSSRAGTPSRLRCF